MMVEHELRTEEQLKESSDQKNGVRRIAGLNHVKSASDEDSQSEVKLPQQRHGIFDNVTQCAACLDPQWMSKNVNSLQNLDPLLTAGACRTNDRHLIAILGKRRRFLPHSSVKRDRKIFDY